MFKIQVTPGVQNIQLEFGHPVSVDVKKVKLESSYSFTLKYSKITVLPTFNLKTPCNEFDIHVIAFANAYTRKTVQSRVLNF